MFRIVMVACATALLGLPAGEVLADEPLVARAHHRWARFEPGAWTLARIVIENVEDGAVTGTSTTEQRTTLVEVDDDGAVLRIEAKIEVDGKTFDAPTQTVRQLFTGDIVSPTSTYQIKSAGSGTVTIEGRAHACQVLNVEIADPSSMTSLKCYYDPLVEPYLLRSESKTTTDETVNQQTTIETLALAMPFHVQDRIVATTISQEVVTKAKSVERSLVRSSFDVPGATLSRSSKESDPDGRLVRRSTFELLEFGTAPAP